MLEAAGVGAGMRVLDLGTGAGNVALLAAEMVGPSGQVVSVDRDARAIALAAAHAERAGVTNVEYAEGDLQTPDLPAGPFDAVIGRFVLMYLADPASTLRAAAALLRPGGIVCFQEVAHNTECSSPAGELIERVHTAVTTTFQLTGADPYMGLRLHRVFTEAGLPRPVLRGETIIASGADAPVWVFGNLARGMAAHMERLGVGEPAEARSPTLDERLLAELRAQDALMMSPLLVGAWARVPA
jgi:SAM-dependent methyltransferase